MCPSKGHLLFQFCFPVQQFSASFWATVTLIQYILWLPRKTEGIAFGLHLSLQARHCSSWDPTGCFTATIPC